MQIPTGNFGNAVARPGPMVDIPNGDPIGAAAQRTTQIAGSVVNDMASQDRQRQEEQRRAAAALTLAKTSNAMHDAHDEVALGVQNGTIAPDKASSELSQRIAKTRDEALSGYSDPAQRDVMDAHLMSTEGALQRSLTGAVVKRQQHDAAGSIDDFGEQMGRAAMRDGPQTAVQRYTAFVRNTAPSAGLDDKAQGRLIQAFAEKTHADFFQNAATGALTAGNVDALRQVREQLSGPDGDAADPHRRASLIHTIFGWEQSLLAKQDRAANQADAEKTRRFNAAVDVFNKGTDIALGGGYFSPEFIQQMTETAAGTEMAPAVSRLIASQRNIAGFASMSAPDRAAYIERARAERADPSKGTDPAGDRLLTAMETMDGKLREQAKDNPWAAAQRAGVIQEAPQMTASDPQSAIAVMQARMQNIRTVEAWTGQKVSPLQPQEVDQVGKMVRALPIDQAATMLSSFGAAVGDSERVAAVAKQLHDKDGALGLAMLYASAQTTEGRRTAELVLRGDQAVKDKTAAIDPAKETGWKGTIAKEIRGAYSNREAEDAAIESAYLIAAAKYAEGKGTDLDNAVRLATGGIVERNGQKFPLPYGMTESDFDKRLAGIKPADLAGQAPGGQVLVGRTPMPLEQFVESLPKASLVHAGQGLYSVRAGAQYVTNERGQRIVLRIAP